MALAGGLAVGAGHLGGNSNVNPSSVKKVPSFVKGKNIRENPKKHAGQSIRGHAGPIRRLG